MIRIIFACILLCYVKTEAQTSVLTKADSLYALGNYNKAITLYKTQPPNAKTGSKIAAAYEALGHYDKALAYYKTSVQADSSKLLTRYKYAKLLAKTKKQTLAESEFKALISTDSLNPNYQYQLGLVYQQENDSLAMVAFKKAFKLDTTHQKAIFKIAKYHLVQRQPDSVAHYTNIGLSSYENNVELISLNAQNDYYKGDNHSAISGFEKLLELNEKTLFIYEKLGTCYANTYNYAKAIAYFEEALSIAPEKPGNVFNLGMVYAHLKQFKKAETYIKKAIALQDVPLGNEYLQLGLLYNRQKKYNKGIAAFETAIQEAPENERAIFFLLNTKAEVLTHIDDKIKLHESFLKKYPKSSSEAIVKYRLSKLKEEKFMQGK
ncbi:hypothetical protein IA57_07075 [Mangrovimonas yunxiaonensis]|uniref:Tetratricopeptide repeat protein 21A/21B fourth ARM domain-containing protein n=1 Tax=Mangrovimonas yunxiaonensis TaxID=1197477 RepID=A0A084TLJ8_9FLAO|nr:tetratricopeptide repeat protein [Mangrovimonas yunxiaonensis]KFB01584.1 hypothetical protein IA57_07075 [Mangrovimonas yunxiaonensis]GGH35817.1 hypothetical protein GCM10011364_02640 [Mangrovimonas yunxiaonensis]